MRRGLHFRLSTLLLKLREWRYEWLWSEYSCTQWLEDVLLCEVVAVSAVGEGTMASTGQALHKGLEGMGGCCGQGKGAKKLQAGMIVEDMMDYIHEQTKWGIGASKSQGCTPYSTIPS
jgi:hypothetical protein